MIRLRMSCNYQQLNSSRQVLPQVSSVRAEWVKGDWNVNWKPFSSLNSIFCYEVTLLFTLQYHCSSTENTPQLTDLWRIVLWEFDRMLRV